MTARTGEMLADLPCHRCGYDLRAHPEEGKCPECGASLAESRRLAAIPRRPAWRDSDPRWRRRMLIGTWMLVLLPLMEALRTWGGASSVPVPSIFGYGAVRTLDETLFAMRGVHELLFFCIGVALLFSHERGRRRSRLDWTRRWGVICSYVVLLLGAAQVLFVVALVMAGIGAMLQGMPLKYQPGVTPLLVQVSTGYLRYGAHPMTMAVIVQVAFSSIVILLACIPLFDALRSSGSKRLAAILVAPLALFSLMHLVQVAWYGLGFSTAPDMFRYGVYFWPELLVRPAGTSLSGSAGAIFAEVAKWCIVLAIAVCLSIAQVAAWWRGRKTRAQEIVAVAERGAAAAQLSQAT